MATDDPASQGWHLDRRLPVALLIALAAQLAGGVWFASQLNFTVARTVEDLVRLERRVGAVEEKRDDLQNRITRIEEKLSAQNDLLRRIEDALSRFTPPGR